MIIKNISGVETFFGWIPPFGRRLAINEETPVEDKVALTDEFKTSHAAGSIGVVSYSDDEFDQVVQKELSIQPIDGANIVNGTLTPEKFCEECLVIVRMPYYVTGYRLEWVSNSQIKLNPGYAREDGGLGYSISSEIDIPLDITVSGPGGLDTGVENSDAWYYVWVARDPVANDIIAVLSLSATSPILPPEYIYKRRVGSVRNKLGHFLKFVQSGDDSHREYIYDEDLFVKLLLLANGASGTYADIDTAVLCPETASKAELGVWCMPPIAPVPSAYLFLRPKGSSAIAYRMVMQNTAVTVHMPLGVDQDIQYQCILGTKIFLSVFGYSEDI